MTEKETESKRYPGGSVVYLLALIIGSGASFAIATYWLEVSSGWLALLVGGVFSLLGAFVGETVVDAIMFSLIVGIMVTVFMLFGPEIEILKAGIIPVATGLCTGKLVAGISSEVSA